MNNCYDLMLPPSIMVLFLLLSIPPHIFNLFVRTRDAARSGGKLQGLSRLPGRSYQEWLYVYVAQRAVYQNGLHVCSG